MNYVKQTGMLRPNLMVSIKIAELFAIGEVGCISIYDEDIKRWDAAIVRANCDDIDFNSLQRGEYQILFSPEIYKWKKEDHAIIYINKILDEVLTVVQTMSN